MRQEVTYWPNNVAHCGHIPMVCRSLRLWISAVSLTYKTWSVLTGHIERSGHQSPPLARRLQLLSCTCKRTPALGHSAMLACTGSPLSFGQRCRPRATVLRTLVVTIEATWVEKKGHVGFNVSLHIGIIEITETECRLDAAAASLQGAQQARYDLLDELVCQLS